MRKKNLIFTVIFYIMALPCISFAESSTIFASGGFDVSSEFSISTMAGGGATSAQETSSSSITPAESAITFTNVDPMKDMVYPDGHKQGESDITVICYSNIGQTWYLKIHCEAVAPFKVDNLFYYLGKPWYNGQQMDGLQFSPGWRNLPITSTLVYTSGLDINNTPSGTYFGFNFYLNPAGLRANITHKATIYYSITLSP